MPTPSFSKDITSIFNNNDLKDELKYDITCRLVCEALEVATVSMLIYDAQIDKLRCKGNYIAPRIRSKYSVVELEIERIIENVCVFEYFDSEISDLRHSSFANFKTSIINGETNKNYKITEEEFDSLKLLWLNNNHKKLYAGYKEKIHAETHLIDDSTLSGRYFSKLLGFGKILTSEIENSLMTSAPQKGESFFKTWKATGITIPHEELHYIGLPLFATERYTGIIRITTFKDPKSTIHEIFEDSDPGERDFQFERLNNFAQLISLHLKTNYYLDGFRALSNLEIDNNNNIKIEKEELDEVCNILTSVIRCNGCIIRLTSNPADGPNPPIKGISDSLREYLSYLKQNTSLSFSEDIYGLLKRKHKNEEEIKAINFSIPGDSDADIFVTNEYYYDQDNRLNSNVENRGRQFRDFTPEYIQILRKLQMREIVVLKLEFLDAGFLVLSNTQNRKFTNSDIEMILLASKRIGLEIKHHHDTERIKEQNKIIAQEEHARLIVHQIGAPVRALSGHAQNLDEKIFKEHEVPSKIAQLNRMSFALLRQINSLQKYLDWEVKPIFPKNETIFYLQKYIRSRAIQFEGLTVGTKLRIWTIVENADSFYDYCNFEKGLFDEILNCLLDNAVKYSFSDYEMSKYGINFNSKDPYSEGHIHIKVNSTEKKLEIAVENYGSSIEEKEYAKIFDRGTRGKFGRKKSPIGSGIGLYLAKKVVLAFNGTIEVLHDKSKSKTSFKVMLPVKKNQ